MSRDNDIAKAIARMALKPTNYDATVLREVLDFCWEQLGWRATTTELLVLLEEMRLSLDEMA